MKSPLYISLALLAALVGPVACGCSSDKPESQVDSSQSAPKNSSTSDQRVRSAPAPTAPQAAPSSSTLSGQGNGAAGAPGDPSGEPADGLPTEDGSPSKLRETGESLWRVFGGALGGLRGGSDDAPESEGADESSADESSAAESSKSAESNGEQNPEAPLPNAAP